MATASFTTCRVHSPLKRIPLRGEPGLRRGDRLDLARMRCAPVDTNVCASLLALWAGVNYVIPGREGTLLIAATGEHASREVTLVAERRPTNRLLELVVVLDTIAGILVVLGAAWLVWTRPGAMTWGFFVYVIQFNPGQAFQFYAWLQQWPWALLVQTSFSVVMQSVAYAGLMLFALRAPIDRAEGRWRAVERALPALAILFLWRGWRAWEPSSAIALRPGCEACS